ncbi:MAG TPA: GAF domain-containing protein [Cytophagaceae bacterium]|nr:GAF domain-containing protein [Cytophagaceae bacterium]
MASKIYAYYLKAGELGGLQARTRLSVLTQTSAIQASSVEDSEKNIKLFEDAMKQLSLEFSSEATYTNKETASSITTKEGDHTAYLRKHISIFSDLMTKRMEYIGDLPIAERKITEAIAQAIHVEKVGVWLFEKEQSSLRCEDLFIRSAHQHQKGFQWNATEYPRYFASVKSEKTIAANDAHLDPRTSELSEKYLLTSAVNSMLVVPVYAENKLAGTICVEHTESLRAWTSDEENFLYMMSNILTMALEVQKKQFAFL